MSLRPRSIRICAPMPLSCWTMRWRRFAIELAAFMEMNLRERARLFGGFNTETASRVVQIEKDAAVFLGDGGQRAGDKFATIASRGAENVSGEAVRVDAH